MFSRSGSVAVELEVVPEGGDGLGGEQEPLPGLEPAHVVEVPAGDGNEGGGGRGRLEETRDVHC